MFKKISVYVLSLSFIFGAAPVIFSSEALALTDRCPRHQVKTELRARRQKPKFFRGSLNGINDYLQSHSVLAFAQDPFSVQAQYEFSLRDIGNGRSCVMLNRVVAFYRSAPRIVMPREFSRNSCEFKIIFAHEERHLNVFLNYFDRSEKQYAAFLGRIARDVPVSTPVTTPEETGQMQIRIRDHFDKQFAERVSTSIAEMQALQQKIDSPQEYTFTGRKIERCGALEARDSQQNKKTFYDIDR